MKKVLSWAIALSAVLGSCIWLAYVESSVGPAYGARFPEWTPTLRVALIGILCIASTFVALRVRNWPAFLFHAAVSLLGIWFAYLSVLARPEQREPFSNVTMPHSLIAATFLLIVPGVFWYITGRAGWPVLVSEPVSLAAKIAVPIGLVVATTVGALVMDFMTIWRTECHGSEQPFTRPLSPDQAVFTARIVRSWKLMGPDDSQPSVYWRRYWSLAWVQKYYWGLPWWNGKLAILLTTTRGSGLRPPRGEIEFVDGRRLRGSATRFLPVFDTFCTRTGSIADAEVDLRVLRDGPLHDGVRILGTTGRLTGNPEFPRWTAIPSVSVRILGPSGLTTVESDERGIFDVTGLPAGTYEILRPPVTVGVPPSWRDIQCDLRVAAGDIRECNVLLR